MAFTDIYTTDKRYSIIDADPPWLYGSRPVRSGRYSQLDYNQMPTADICKIPVERIAADNCALTMWFTASFVKDAIVVAEAWGFKVIRIDTVWNKKKQSGKPHATPGGWGMTDCEFKLLATRGKACSMQKGKRNMYTGHDVPVDPVHSKKPDYFLDLLDKRFMSLPRIELFARRAYPGWDYWGDQVK